MQKGAIATAAATFDMEEAAVRGAKPKQGDSLAGVGVCAAQYHGYSHILASRGSIVPVVSEQGVETIVSVLPI